MGDPLAALCARLEEARALRPSADIQNLPRRVVHEALDAVHVYLVEVGVEDRLRSPILHLLGAIQDAEDGRKNPILTPGPYTRPGQATLQMDIAEFAMASAAVTILQGEPGVSTDTALSKMAAAIGADKAVLREFRKNLMKGRASEVAMREYNGWIAMRPTYPLLSRSDFVAIMLDKAKRLSLQKG